MIEKNHNPCKDDHRTNHLIKETSLISGSHYKITVAGRIDKEWVDWFGDLSLSYEQCGYSTISGFIVDQSALHGILAQIRDLALPLVSLTRLVSEQER